MIREYGLTAPTLPRFKKSEFAYMTRSTASLYQREIGKKIDLGTSWKILVEVVPQISAPKHRNLLGVLVVQTAGDPAEIFSLQGPAVQARALDWLVAGISHLADELSLDKSQFMAAAEKVREAGYVNIYTWRRPLDSPRKDKKAEIVVDHGVQEARILGRVITQAGEVLREVVLTRTRPDELLFVPLLGSLKWVNDDEAELSSKSGEERWIF